MDGATTLARTWGAGPVKLRWAKGRFCIRTNVEGSRAALPDVNMLGTALKREANGIAALM